MKITTAHEKYLSDQVLPPLAPVSHIRIFPEFVQQLILTNWFEGRGFWGCSRENLWHSQAETNLDQSECRILMT